MSAPGITAEEIAAFRERRNGTAPPPEPFTTYTADALAALPPLEWLIPGLLPAAGLTVNVGASGVGKTFLTVAQTCCIATGTNWNGRTVRQGPALYVAAEGSTGLLRRVDAWCAENSQRRPEHLHFLPEVVSFLDNHDTARLSLTVAAIDPPPALIVVDTLARAMPGGDAPWPKLAWWHCRTA